LALERLSSINENWKPRTLSEIYKTEEHC
jgi:hypothetical protein